MKKSVIHIAHPKMENTLTLASPIDTLTKVSVFINPDEIIVTRFIPNFWERIWWRMRGI